MKKLLFLLFIFISIVANSQHHMMSVLASQVSGAGNAVYEDNGGHAYATSTTINISYPATINANDILIIQISSRTVTSFTTPSGWNLIFQDAGSSYTIGYFWKRATGSESGTQSVAAANSGQMYGVMLRFSGCATTGSPFETTSELSVSSTSSPIIPAMTGSGSLAFAFINVSDNVSLTGETDYSEVYQLLSSEGFDNNLAGFSYTNSGSSTPSDQLSLASSESVGMVAVIFK